MNAGTHSLSALLDFFLSPLSLASCLRCSQETVRCLCGSRSAHRLHAGAFSLSHSYLHAHFVTRSSSLLCVVPALACLSVCFKRSAPARPVRHFTPKHWHGPLKHPPVSESLSESPGGTNPQPAQPNPSTNKRVTAVPFIQHSHTPSPTLLFCVPLRASPQRTRQTTFFSSLACLPSISSTPATLQRCSSTKHHLPLSRPSTPSCSVCQPAHL